MTSPPSARRADLSSVLIRIDRAKAHLNDFDNRARMISTACQMTRECDEQRSEYIFRLSKGPVVPPVLSAIIGDAIHNLRVSLDYLMWQLVVAAGETPNDDTSFPILTTPPTPDRYGHTLPNISPRIPTNMRRLLDDVQPYKRPKPENDEPIGFNIGPYNDNAEVCRFKYWGRDCNRRFSPSMKFTVRLSEPAAG